MSNENCDKLSYFFEKKIKMSCSPLKYDIIPNTSYSWNGSVKVAGHLRPDNNLDSSFLANLLKDNSDVIFPLFKNAVNNSLMQEFIYDYFKWITMPHYLKGLVRIQKA